MMNIEEHMANLNKDQHCWREQQSNQIARLQRNIHESE